MAVTTEIGPNIYRISIATGCDSRVQSAVADCIMTEPTLRTKSRTSAAPGLFLAVLFDMSLHRLFSMPSAMNYVAPRGVSVVCRLFVMSGIVVLGGLLMVMGGMLEVF